MAAFKEKPPSHKVPPLRHNQHKECQESAALTKPGWTKHPHTDCMQTGKGNWISEETFVKGLKGPSEAGGTTSAEEAATVQVSTCS